MADRTESSILIAAAPGAILDVIADFDRYPEWAGEVKKLAVISEDGDGWADQVEFTLSAGAIKDTYVLEYDWDVAANGTGNDIEGAASVIPCPPKAAWMAGQLAPAFIVTSACSIRWPTPA